MTRKQIFPDHDFKMPVGNAEISRKADDESKPSPEIKKTSVTLPATANNASGPTPTLVPSSGVTPLPGAIQLDGFVVSPIGASNVSTALLPQPALQPALQQSQQRSASSSFKHEWAPGAHDDVLEVRCKETLGFLHKDKFGSGGRGKCMEVEGKWMTPNEFEVLAGRASSKDWKRSVRFQGRPLGNLIEDGILRPHASSCTCVICGGSPMGGSTGAVRLHVPAKRRQIGSAATKKHKSDANEEKTRSLDASQELVRANQQSLLQHLANPSLQQQIVESGEVEALGRQKPQSLQILTSESSECPSYYVNPYSQLTCGGQYMMVAPNGYSMPARLTSVPTAPTAPMMVSGLMPTSDQGDVSEMGSPNSETGSIGLLDSIDSKQFSQLEDTANSLLGKAQELKEMLQIARSGSSEEKQALLQSLKNQSKKETEELQQLKNLQLSIPQSSHSQVVIPSPKPFFAMSVPGNEALMANTSGFQLGVPTYLGSHGFVPTALASTTSPASPAMLQHPAALAIGTPASSGLLQHPGSLAASVASASITPFVDASKLIPASSSSSEVGPTLTPFGGAFYLAPSSSFPVSPWVTTTTTTTASTPIPFVMASGLTQGASFAPSLVPAVEPAS